MSLCRRSLFDLLLYYQWCAVYKNSGIYFDFPTVFVDIIVGVAATLFVFEERRKELNAR